MPEPTTEEIREKVMQLMDNLSPFKEAAAGYRAELLRDGWPEEHSAAIAASLLIEMNANLFRTIGRASDG